MSCCVILPTTPIALLCLTVCWTQGRQGVSGKLEGNSRGCGSCRRVYSLLTSPAATGTQDYLVMDPENTAVTQPQGLARWSLYMFSDPKWPVAKLHAHCSKCSQLLHNCIYKTWGERARPVPSWLICSSPTDSIGILTCRFWKISTIVLPNLWTSLVVQMVKNLPSMWEALVWSLGPEEPLEKGIATHSSILAWRIPWTRGAWWATVHGVTKRQTW